MMSVDGRRLVAAALIGALLGFSVQFAADNVLLHPAYPRADGTYGWAAGGSSQLNWSCLPRSDEFVASRFRPVESRKVHSLIYMVVLLGWLRDRAALAIRTGLWGAIIGALLILARERHWRRFVSAAAICGALAGSGQFVFDFFCWAMPGDLSNRTLYQCLFDDSLGEPGSLLYGRLLSPADSVGTPTEILMCEGILFFWLQERGGMAGLTASIVAVAAASSLRWSERRRQRNLG